MTRSLIFTRCKKSYYILIISILFAGCSSSPNRSIPNTPEQYTIGGVVSNDSVKSHELYCPPGEEIETRLIPEKNELAYAVYDQSNNKLVFKSKNESVDYNWSSGLNCSLWYKIEIFNSDKSTTSSTPKPYRLQVRRSD